LAAYESRGATVWLVARQPYRQVLPALNLSLERYTEAVPADGGWYLLRDGETLGRYRSEAEARAAWKEHVRESGWTPPKRDFDPDEARRREQAERWSRNRAG
jgi:hypothetical protein